MREISRKHGPEHMPHKAPHELDKSKAKRAVIYATAIAALFGLTLALLNFPLNVVIPSTAPVWAGLGALMK